MRARYATCNYSGYAVGWPVADLQSRDSEVCFVQRNYMVVLDTKQPLASTGDVRNFIQE
jgi:hypothetical protein